MSSIRIIAILIAVAISLGLYNWLGMNWYVSFGIGIVGYFLTNYFSWAIKERGRLQRELDQLVEKAKRGEPLD